MHETVLCVLFHDVSVSVCLFYFLTEVLNKGFTSFLVAWTAVKTCNVFALINMNNKECVS